MIQFSFATAQQIVFGEGSLQKIGPLAGGLGRRALVVGGSRMASVDRLAELLAEAGVGAVPFPVSGEPSVQTVADGVLAARAHGCDLVIGIGGGSALDAAKAIAAVLTNPGDLLDYLEVVGKGMPLTVPPAAMIAIPTTAGTGSEVTRNAVLSVPEKQVKVSLRSPMMLPRLALVDPTLSFSMPAEVTAATGMDALTQVIEPFVSRQANPFTDMFCREGIVRAARSLLAAYQDGSDRQSRIDMAYASLMGGLALANAGLGAVHGFAGPIGGMFDAPHGAVCARLLPLVSQANIRALSEREPVGPALDRYREVARLVTGSEAAAPEDLTGWLVDMTHGLNIPPLGTYGVKAEHLDALVEKSQAASSMKANPIQLSPQEMREVLQAAL